MLNCTDLACVLHHHHFYAHLHHLKHRLQDDNDSTGAGTQNELDNNEDIKSNINDPDSDLSSLSHLDAPNDVIYIICGVVIAMLLVGVIIVLVAVTINKLRKREESNTVTPIPPATVEVQSHHPITNTQQQQQQQTDNETYSNNIHNNNNNNNGINIKDNNNQHHQQQQRVTFVRTSGVVGTGNGTAAVVAATVDGQCVTTTDVDEWTFPPKAPTPHIYHCMNPELLVAAAASDKNGFKGFRKQFSGRFKRLVARKPDPAPVIPPELRPQLKTIYVY